MRSWVADLIDAAQGGEPVCLVTVVDVRGSAPREVGARMLVGKNHSTGTIGGGQLEYQCLSIAAAMLKQHRDSPELRRFPLGSNCGQCCGGVVQVMFEPDVWQDKQWLDDLRRLAGRQDTFVVESCLSGQRSVQERPIGAEWQWLGEDGVFRQSVGPAENTVVVFGAGHVGSAVVAALSPLECAIHWVDSRSHVFPEQMPENVRCVHSARPEDAVAAAPAGTSYLIMTHSHALDLSITIEVLRRDDMQYCGLIGSATKRRRFEAMMLKQGVVRAQLDRLTCPVGIEPIQGKRPAEIAVAVAAQLQIAWEARSQAATPRQNLRAI